MPSVTELTAYSSSVTSSPMIRSTALKQASTGPVPVAASWKISPVGPMTRTVAVGISWLPQETCTWSRR